MEQEADFLNVLCFHFEIVGLNPLGSESIIASAGFISFHALSKGL